MCRPTSTSIRQLPVTTCQSFVGVPAHLHTCQNASHGGGVQSLPGRDPIHDE